MHDNDSAELLQQARNKLFNGIIDQNKLPFKASWTPTLP